MDDKKKRIIKLIESYINEFHKHELEEFYGSKTEIEIKDIFYSTNQKSVLIESKIVLGQLINEEVLDRKMIDYLLQDAVEYIYPNENFKISVSFDV